MSLLHSLVGLNTQTKFIGFFAVEYKLRLQKFITIYDEHIYSGSSFIVL